MPVFKTKIDLHSDDFRRNDERMKELVGDLKEKMKKISIGGSEEARGKHIERGKLLPRERVNLLLDSGSPFLEFSQLAAHDMYDNDVPSAGIITGIGRVSEKEVVIVANEQL
jgi:Acetyl-CoA carboxylase, carboxyltransferase component (subunits alpha and beta)